MSRSFRCTILLGPVMFAPADAQTTSPLPAQEFDVMIKNGTVYDGSGGAGRKADVALRGDRIAGAGDFKQAKARLTINAGGLAVAPGFINMLSWTEEGGYPALFKRLHDPATRQKIAREVETPSDAWENLYLAAGHPTKFCWPASRRKN